MQNCRSEEVFRHIGMIRKSSLLSLSGMLSLLPSVVASVLSMEVLTWEREFR